MKKFFKVLFGLALVGGAIAGAFYFIKSVFMKDYLDDYDDDDFDNDLYDEDDEEDDREYVTITPQNEEDEEDTKKESEPSKE